MLESMELLASDTYTSTSAPIQQAAAVAFEGGEDIERYLAQTRRVLAALGRWCARRLNAAHISCAQPQGGFYVFPDFESARDRLQARGIDTSERLCERLLEERGVAILPGSSFGRPPHELTARIACVDFDGARALAAVSVIPREQPLDITFMKRHCGRVVDAVERIVEWLEQ